MAMFTIHEVEEATEGVLLAPCTQDTVFSEVDTDTRAIADGSLFVAFKGERFDGHNFVLQALQDGAAGAVVSEIRDEYKTVHAPIFVVKDTVAAYQGLARFHRRRLRTGRVRCADAGWPCVRACRRGRPARRPSPRAA